LTIDRPERRNAIDGATAELLREGYRSFVADEDARVLVLTGAAEVAFCAGADLKAIESFAARLELDEGPLGFSRLIAPKPTIAAISGWCLAGGLELALWCDLRIATEEAKLGFTERRFGVPLSTEAPSGCRASSGSAAPSKCSSPAGSWKPKRRSELGW
jgi:enoyl-CoA hydratase